MRSLMKIKNCGPKIEPCGTHFNQSPLRLTIKGLLLKSNLENYTKGRVENQI